MKMNWICCFVIFLSFYDISNADTITRELNGFVINDKKYADAKSVFTEYISCQKNSKLPKPVKDEYETKAQYNERVLLWKKEIPKSICQTILNDKDAYYEMPVKLKYDAENETFLFEKIKKVNRKTGKPNSGYSFGIWSWDIFNPSYTGNEPKIKSYDVFQKSTVELQQYGSSSEPKYWINIFSTCFLDDARKLKVHENYLKWRIYGNIIISREYDKHKRCRKYKSAFSGPKCISWDYISDVSYGYVFNVKKIVLYDQSKGRILLEIY